MSDKLVLCVWQNCPEGGAELALLQAIAESANDQGNCYLRMDQLAHAARLSRRSAIRAVRALRENRLLVTCRKLGHGGRLVYQLNVGKLERSRRVGVDPRVIEAQHGRETGATEEALLSRVVAA